MMRDKDLFSEEVQEIMGQIPPWIIRWGIMVILLIVTLFVLGSYIFKYPKVVSVPLLLTSVNTPAPLICKTSGKIEKWFVSDGEKVMPGTPVALLENTGDYQDIVLLKRVIQSLGDNWEQEVLTVEPQDDLVLGSTQSIYTSFQKAYYNFKHYINLDLLSKKAVLLSKRIHNQETYYRQQVEQQSIKQRAYSLIEQRYKEDSAYFVQGGYGILKSEVELSEQNYLRQKGDIIAFGASIVNAETALLQLQENYLDLVTKREYEMKQFKVALDENKRLLELNIEEWLDKYLLTSPITGEITFTNFWSENQIVKAGNRLATVVPEQATQIIAKALIPSSKIGLVEIGQKVHIKLSGFSYVEYGMLEGRINNISKVPEGKVYVAEIFLVDGMKSSYKKTLKFIQEMDGTADIITHDTRLIYRFIGPLRAIMRWRS